MRIIIVFMVTVLALSASGTGICGEPFPTVQYGDTICPKLTGSYDSKGNAVFSMKADWGKSFTFMFSPRMQRRYEVKLVETSFNRYGPSYTFRLYFDYDAHKKNYQKLKFQVKDKEGREIPFKLRTGSGGAGRLMISQGTKSMPSLIYISYDPTKKKL